MLVVALQSANHKQVTSDVVQSCALKFSNELHNATRKPPGFGAGDSRRGYAQGGAVDEGGQ